MEESSRIDLHGEFTSPVARLIVTPVEERGQGRAIAVVEIINPTIRVEDLFILAEKAAEELRSTTPDKHLPSWAQRLTSTPTQDPKAEEVLRVEDKSVHNVGELLLAYTKAIMGLYKIGEDPLGDAVRMVAAGFSVQLVEAVKVQRFGPSPLEGMAGLWTMMKRKERQDEKSGHTGEEGVREGGDPGGGC